MSAREQGDEFVLGGVGVLILIDEYFLETLLVFFENVGAPPEHLQGARQQVIEIHRARIAQGALIGGRDLQGSGVDAERSRFGILRLPKRGLAAPHLIQDRPGRVALLADIRSRHATLDER